MLHQKLSNADFRKGIATKAVDNSAGVRKKASKALAEAVKAPVARKNMQPQMAGYEDKSQGVHHQLRKVEP